jgi:hypothetical protein
VVLVANQHFFLIGGRVMGYGKRIKVELLFSVVDDQQLLQEWVQSQSIADSMRAEIQNIEYLVQGFIPGKTMADRQENYFVVFIQPTAEGQHLYLPAWSERIRSQGADYQSKILKEIYRQLSDALRDRRVGLLSETVQYQMRIKHLEQNIPNLSPELQSRAQEFLRAVVSGDGHQILSYLEKYFDLSQVDLNVELDRILAAELEKFVVEVAKVQLPNMPVIE